MVAYAQPPDAPSATEHVIVAGDTFWDLASQTYGDPFRWTVIQAANPDTVPERLGIGTTIRIPLPGPGTGRHRAPDADADDTDTGSDDTGSDTPGARPVVDTPGQDATAGLAARVVTAAKAKVGLPYVWGGESDAEGGFDCSGLVQYAYAQVGIHLPRTTWSMAGVGRAVKLDELAPGDLIFSNGGGHVVMYIGDGQVIEAPRPGEQVRIAPLRKTGITAIRRVLPTGASAPTTVSGLKALARTLVPAGQFDCFDAIITRESAWNPRAVGPNGDYGLGQAYPGSKMASAGSDWRTNPATQIRWTLGYMASRYGSPCAAWSFWKAHKWY